MSSYAPLTLETLAEIDDGVLGVLVKRALLNAARDCVDRPADKTTRKVVLTLGYKPVADSNGHLKSIDFLPNVTTKIPAYCPAPIALKANNNGFFFIPDDVEGAKADDV